MIERASSSIKRFQPLRDMADQLKKKRPREENEGKFMAWPQPNIVLNAVMSSSELLTNGNKPQIQEELIERDSYFHNLRLRELGKKVKLPKFYRDYYVHNFEFLDIGSILFIVPGDDIIFVVHSMASIVFFRRHGDQISAIRDDKGNLIECALPGKIRSACYNIHNNSFLVDTELKKPGSYVFDKVQIISFENASMQAGQSPNPTELFPGESCILHWDFDIPLCRGMIHSSKDRVFKFCELKEYRFLFTVPDLGGTVVGSYAKSLSPGNMDVVMYEGRKVFECGSQGISLRIYSKLNGKLRKNIILPQEGTSLIEFVAICGSDTLVMQRYELEMEVVDISCENPKVTNTNIRAICEPYYLHKRSQFICCTESTTIHICNLQGQILVTLEDHTLVEGPMFRPPNLFVNSYISRSQDIIISLCNCFCFIRGEWLYTVNVSSIATGECLAKMTLDIPNCSEFRKALLKYGVHAFGYDERTDELFTGNIVGLCSV